MRTENIQKFIEAASADPALQKKVRAVVRAAAGKDPGGALAALAAEEGFTISVAEFAEYDTARAVDELDLDQLDAVSGGNLGNDFKNTKSPFGP